MLNVNILIITMSPLMITIITIMNMTTSTITSMAIITNIFIAELLRFWQ